VATQAIGFPEIASPQVIGMLKQAAQRGEVLYSADEVEEDSQDECDPEDEWLSEDCEDGDCEDCDDPDCTCDCHEEEDEIEEIEDEGELDDEDDLTDDEDDDILDDECDKE
jgi:hypothetical protein